MEAHRTAQHARRAAATGRRAGAVQQASTRLRDKVEKQAPHSTAKLPVDSALSIQAGAGGLHAQPKPDPKGHVSRRLMEAAHALADLSQFDVGSGKGSTTAWARRVRPKVSVGAAIPPVISPPVASMKPVAGLKLARKLTGGSVKGKSNGSATGSGATTGMSHLATGNRGGFAKDRSSGSAKRNSCESASTGSSVNSAGGSYAAQTPGLNFCVAGWGSPGYEVPAGSIGSGSVPAFGFSGAVMGSYHGGVPYSSSGCGPHFCNQPTAWCEGGAGGGGSETFASYNSRYAGGAFGHVTQGGPQMGSGAFENARSFGQTLINYGCGDGGLGGVSSISNSSTSHGSRRMEDGRFGSVASNAYNMNSTDFFPNACAAPLASNITDRGISTDYFIDQALCLASQAVNTIDCMSSAEMTRTNFSITGNTSGRTCGQDNNTWTNNSNSGNISNTDDYALARALADGAPAMATGRIGCEHDGHPISVCPEGQRGISTCEIAAVNHALPGSVDMSAALDPSRPTDAVCADSAVAALCVGAGFVGSCANSNCSSSMAPADACTIPAKTAVPNAGDSGSVSECISTITACSPSSAQHVPSNSSATPEEAVNGAVTAVPAVSNLFSGAGEAIAKAIAAAEAKAAAAKAAAEAKRREEVAMRRKLAKNRTAEDAWASAAAHATAVIPCSSSDQAQLAPAAAVACPQGASADTAVAGSLVSSSAAASVDELSSLRIDPAPSDALHHGVSENSEGGRGKSSSKSASQGAATSHAISGCASSVSEVSLCEAGCSDSDLSGCRVQREGFAAVESGSPGSPSANGGGFGGDCSSWMICS